MEVFYLHGFASSAKSSKAGFFGSRLAALGIALRCPDFNEPDFSSMTITRMVDQVGRELDSVRPQPEATGAGGAEPGAVLIGSSLGAFVAVQAALRWPTRVARLVLLAPAVDLRPQRLAELGDRPLEQWQASNTLNVFHYGYGRMMALGYGLYEDARRYDAMGAQLTLPIQVFQGRRDTAVDPVTVEQWATARPHVELHMLDDDHQLLGSLEYIWEHVRRFVTL